MDVESGTSSARVESICAKLPDVCRVCLLDESDSQTELYSIDDVYVPPNSVEHMNSFRDILSIFVNDEFDANSERLLPANICTKCAARANEAYQFMEQCQRSDKLLEQCFERMNAEQGYKTNESSIDEDTANGKVIEVVITDARRVKGESIELVITDARPSSDDEKSDEQETKNPLQPSPPKMVRKGKRWFCDKCSKSFSQPQTLRRHYRIHDETGSFKKSCTECGRLFLRSDDMTRHMRTHTGERPYKCKLCPNRYKQGSELKEHMLTHSQEKRFSCTECGKKFASRNGLFVHRKIHRGEKPHACPHCNKRFTTSSERISHVRHIHKT